MRQFIQKMQIKLLLVVLLLGLSGTVSAGQPANMTDYPNLMRLLQQFYETVNHLQYLKQPNKTVFKSESYQCVQKLLFHPDVVNPALGEQSQTSLLALEQQLGDSANQAALDQVYQTLKKSQEAKTANSADKLGERAMMGLGLIAGEEALNVLLALIDGMNTALDRPELQTTLEKLVLEPECNALMNAQQSKSRRQ